MTIESDTTTAAVIKQANNENLKKNRIQVSNTKKPLFFYVNLAKNVVDAINGSVKYNSVFGDIIQGCKGLLSLMPLVVVKWIPRDVNIMAHRIANVARDFSSSHFWDERSVCVDGLPDGCARRYLQQHDEIELSALGMAITTVVTIAEILKNNGFVNEKSIVTSTVGTKDAAKGRTVQKARIEIVLEKSEKFDTLMTAAQNAAANGKSEKKQTS